jgi:hypothetical protein
MFQNRHLVSGCIQLHIFAFCIHFKRGMKNNSNEDSIFESDSIGKEFHYKFSMSLTPE